MPTNDVLESRLRELYREVRTQNEVIDILRAEIIKLAKRLEKLEALQRNPAEDFPGEQDAEKRRQN